MEKKIIWRNVCLEQQFHIGQIARFFDLPASTLRYWDEVGILTPHKNHTNSYREYTVSDLMTISDIIFYKNLGISLQQSGAMEQAEPEEHTRLLCGKIEALERQQLEIAQRIQKLHNHLAAIETLNKLRQCPFSQAEIDTDCIVSFDLNEIDKLRRYMENPYLYSRVQHSDCLAIEHRGLTVPRAQRSAIPSDQILWERSADSRYVACLVQESVPDDYRSNLPELLSHIQKNHQTGTIISRFLLRAAAEDVVYDFYQTFVEILE